MIYEKIEYFNIHYFIWYLDNSYLIFFKKNIKMFFYDGIIFLCEIFTFHFLNLDLNKKCLNLILIFEYTKTIVYKYKINIQLIFLRKYFIIS